MFLVRRNGDGFCFAGLLAALWLWGALVASFDPLCQAAPPRAKKVLLIGIDGVRPDAMKAAKTPYLDALIKDGAFADDTQILGDRYRRNDTVSGPGWSSILTGVWADKHGVQDNAFKVMNFAKYPDFLWRLKQARPKAKTASFVSWPPIT